MCLLVYVKYRRFAQCVTQLHRGPRLACNTTSPTLRNIYGQASYVLSSEKHLRSAALTNNNNNTNNTNNNRSSSLFRSGTDLMAIYLDVVLVVVLLLVGATSSKKPKAPSVCRIWDKFGENVFHWCHNMYCHPLIVDHYVNCLDHSMNSDSFPWAESKLVTLSVAASWLWPFSSSIPSIYINHSKRLSQQLFTVTVINMAVFRDNIYAGQCAFLTANVRKDKTLSYWLTM